MCIKFFWIMKRICSTDVSDPNSKRRIYSFEDIQLKVSLKLNTMFCWGNTKHGELGLGGLEEDHILVPTKHPFTLAPNIVQVSCGDSHTVMVTGSGEVYSCGNNDHGQLGHERTRTKLEKVDGLSAYRIMTVYCGGAHTLAFNDWGQLLAWGSNSHGQLGMNGGSQNAPKIVKHLATNYVVQVACGKTHSLALTNSGELYSWGANNYGQLGLGKNDSNEANPVVVKSLIGVPLAFVACGANHSFALTKSGAIFGWGANDHGQLGLNDTNTRFYPTQVKTHRSVRIKYIACGEDFSVFLSADGGVFTCGAGIYGQLGHGSISDEILPRKVMELMGSTVTQIACGRKHTLALVPSHGRVYAFGLGSCGQLGSSDGKNANTPQMVLGPWVSSSAVPAAQQNKLNKKTVKPQELVTGVFSGGDHSFITVAPYQNDSHPDDRRIFKDRYQIWSVHANKVAQCRKIGRDDIVDQDMLSYLEIVFKSQACFNSSFLLTNDDHYCCTSKNPGIDLNKVENIFGEIARIENETISDLIWESIVEALIPSLTPDPPDMECLRIYLTLPFYHRFLNAKYCLKLQGPFAACATMLKSQAQKVLGSWWGFMSLEYLGRLITIFKDVLIFHLKKMEQSRGLNNIWIVHSLNLLKMIYSHTYTSDREVPYDLFYLPELNDAVNIQVDYIHWLTDTGTKRVYLCDYPFIFDAQAKTSLLQADQTWQMRSAMSQVGISLAQFLAGGLNVLTESHFLFLNICRENLVETTLAELESRPRSDLKKPLRVKFLGEEAEDGGGVRKEFFLLIMREILDLKYGMFKYYEETRAIWFSELPFKDNAMYSLIGILCGLAIYNFTIIDLPFPLALYKKLLKKKVTYLDLKDLSPSLVRNLQSLLDYDGDDVEEVFCLNFEISRDILGEIVLYPLKPEGKNILVTKENREEYVDLYADFILSKSIEDGFQNFYQGFHSVCGGKLLELFQPHELMSLVVGNENYNWTEFEECCQYKGGYTENDHTIKLFWEVFHELSQEDKRKFLLFLTGSDRIPIQGIKSIQITIQPTGDEKYLPVAHTCFNLLDLPRYKTKERLRYKLLQAIQQHEGFSLV